MGRGGVEKLQNAYILQMHNKHPLEEEEQKSIDKVIEHL